MLQIPQRSAAAHHRFAGKVIGRRRRCGRPLQRPGVPGIRSGVRTFEVRVHHVVSKDERGDSLNHGPDGNDHVPGFPAAAGFIGVDAPRHAQQPGYVHEVEGHVEANHEQPETPFAHALVEHLAGHFREPVVEPSEKAKDDGSHQNIVKMGDDEIGVVQLPVPGSRGKHDSGQTRKQELSYKGSAEQHRRGEAYFASPHGRDPIEDLDPGRDPNQPGREHEERVLRRGHAHREHVVRPHAEADQTNAG